MWDYILLSTMLSSKVEKDLHSDNVVLIKLAPYVFLHCCWHLLWMMAYLGRPDMLNAHLSNCCIKKYYEYYS